MWPAIIAAGIGGTLGYAVSYWIGLYYKEDIKAIWPFSRTLAMLERGQTFFNKWGAVGVFLGHFFGPVRAVIPVIAGMYARSAVAVSAGQRHLSLHLGGGRDCAELLRFAVFPGLTG